MPETLRIDNHAILGPAGSRRILTFTFNGRKVEGFEGESIAAALWAQGIRTLRHNHKGGDGRGMYCGIGHCYECRVTVDGEPDVRACLTPIREGMKVESGDVKPVEAGDRCAS